MIAVALGLVAMCQMTATDYAGIVAKAAQSAVVKFPKTKITDGELAITLARIDRTSGQLVKGSYHGDQAMYPASVVKLFYLVNLANRLQAGTLALTPELERGANDMIVDSVNDATSLVVDVLTDTTSGPELSAEDMKAWIGKRNVVNRWYAGLGYEGINVCQKTWNEGPYGRDRAFYGEKYDNRNRLTPDACVKLMGQVALDLAVPYGGPSDKHWSDWAKTFLKRTIPADGKANEQAAKFSGASLPKGCELWSKAGWTDSVRHDLAWVKLPDGREYIWAIFTKGHSDEEGLIPFVASEILKGLEADKVAGS